MPALGKIIQVLFDAQPLGRPLSLHIHRSCQEQPAAADEQPFATSLQVRQPLCRVELTLRDLPSVDGLELGRSGRLEIRFDPTQDAQRPRQIAIDLAVLVGQELHFAQDALAKAKLVFVGESASGTDNPYSASEVNP